MADQRYENTNNIGLLDFFEKFPRLILQELWPNFTKLAIFYGCIIKIVGLFRWISSSLEKFQSQL